MCLANPGSGLTCSELCNYRCYGSTTRYVAAQLGSYSRLTVLTPSLPRAPARVLGTTSVFSAVLAALGAP
jgi:hypothetical protein